MVLFRATQAGGVDNNWLTLPYTVFLAMWSIGFLSTWQTRENELRFLWGTDVLQDHALEPRREFKGMLRVNEETNREEVQQA